MNCSIYNAIVLLNIVQIFQVYRQLPDEGNKSAACTQCASHIIYTEHSSSSQDRSQQAIRTLFVLFWKWPFMKLMMITMIIVMIF